jgi:hypothetical protein
MLHSTETLVGMFCVPVCNPVFYSLFINHKFILSVSCDDEDCVSVAGSSIIFFIFEKYENHESEMLSVKSNI